VESERAVLIRYTRDGQPRRGSGLRVGGRFVLTADHCANGTDHKVKVGGVTYPATVHVRSETTEVDLAVLVAPKLLELAPLGCALLSRDVADWLERCVALGYPVWKDGPAGQRLAQTRGDVPTSENLDPLGTHGAVTLMTLQITDPEAAGHPVPLEDLDKPKSKWAGMSGAVVVTSDDLVVGVVRSHNLVEGGRMLTVTPLDAIDNLPASRAESMWAALGVSYPRRLPRLPLPVEKVPAVSIAVSQLVVGEIPREPLGFVARETIDRLAAAAQTGRPAVVSAVTGMRGVGKTQVAAAYARARVSDGWGLVGWVSAETRDSLLDGLARIAEAAGVADPDGDSLRSAQRLREHLQARPRMSLVVFDNATDPDTLGAFLPATGRTQVVITSTELAFTELGEPVQVDTFTRAESLDYLRTRTGLVDETGAETVAAELGDLPLAVAQAAATIRRRHWTYARYLEDVRQVPLDQLITHTPGVGYPRSTSAAMLLSVAAAEDDDPTGLTSLVLRVLAALSPDGVSRDLINDLPPNGPPGKVEATLDRCVAGSLLAWSVTGDAVIMHRLLGRVLRERDQTLGRWADTVTAALDLLEPRLFDEGEAWSRREEGAQLVLQIEALWESAGPSTGDLELTRRQLVARSWAERQLAVAADLARAIELGDNTLTDSERVLGSDHPHTLGSRHNLASAYESAGRLGEAIALYEQTVADYERVLGADHPDTLGTRNGLALAYQSALRLDDAIPLHERTVADSERVLGPDHPNTLTARNNLALSYRWAGRLDDAIPLYERTVADRERVLGPDHPNTLITRNNLAAAYASAGRLGEAFPLYEQTLADQERLLGPDHPNTLMSRNNLAAAYQSAGRLDEAIPLFEQSLADMERVLGPDHPDTLMTRNNLAAAYQSARARTGRSPDPDSPDHSDHPS
jgi:tetratricopeptide (TPR) repeat protein